MTKTPGEAINRLGGFGRRDYALVEDPQKLVPLLDRLAGAKWDAGAFELS